MKLNLKTSGVKRNVGILRNYEAAVKPQLTGVIKTRMDGVFAESQSLVPTRTGNLKRSGSVVPIPGGAKIVYDAPYAFRIEFDASLKHPNGQAFFVRQPFRKELKFVRKELRDAAKKPLEQK